MNIKQFLSIGILIASSLVATAQTSTKSKVMHQKAHSSMLARQNQLDKSSISTMIERDIAAREAAGELSRESNAMIDDMLKEAKKYMGTRYVHGAKGPNAFDCSGYTSYIYRQFGISISPSSRAQYTQGTTVDRKSLRKGDLVFFTSPRSGSNVGHVGIVYEVDPDGHNFKFIHASLKGVKISDSKENYYSRRYVGAKRHITE